MSQLLSVNDIATRYQVTKNTVRNWCKEFAAYLSDSARSKPRAFAEVDRQVFALIADMRAGHLKYADIHAALANDQHLDIDVEATAETEPTGQADEVSGSTALAPLDLLDRVLTEVKSAYESRIDDLVDEREKLERELDEERAARLEAEKRAAAAEAERALLKERKSLIARLLGR